ncbi:MAG TPA: ergothioneine biosynthesis protein EgtB [Kofleriaceae bacterium]|nr:ergothioneine biosynthesis protein EgtB [Kofleriaceae bacterium]
MLPTGRTTPPMVPAPSGPSESRAARGLADRFTAVRARTLELCAPLSPEDHVVQPMADASPAKWHLAHTTWFFEAFVLGGPPFDPAFEYLFNSYYEAVGPRVARARRGMLSRPGLSQIHAYRAATDRRVLDALGAGTLDADALARLELGLHHEQQHQELILTDAKYLLGTQPLRPAYRPLARAPHRAPEPLAWRTEAGGIVEIGAPAEGFAFDNERPRHPVLLAPYRIATRPVANAEVLAFIADGGYRDHRLWLSDGWQLVQSERWTAPLYWTAPDDGDGAPSFAIYDLAGVRAVDPGETACHLSLYEADAIARWLGARLPTEAEWEHAARDSSPGGNFADAGRLHPERAPAAPGALAQLCGDVWEWTASSYSPYPGFRPLAGALGEYNGKFMSGQHVLRGGSCLTPAGHVRRTYRNFFPPSARWQMTGARLAADL